MDQVKKFFCSLFDFSFSEFITPRIIKIVYYLAMVMIAIQTIILIAAAFGRSPFLGVVTLVIGAPLAFTLMVIYARILLELIMIIFRINDNIAKLAGTEQINPTEQTRSFTPPCATETSNPIPPPGT
jgi:hypothetical protein